jgi:hypothetical protein
MSRLASFGNQFLQQLAVGDTVRDYQHGSRTFVNGVYRLNPKLQNLFHVYISLNPTVAMADNENPNSKYEIGLLAKSATLPKFTIQNKVLNSYNRKNIVQERVNYDPISIVFHDDSSNVVRNFWTNYFRYYYRDVDHQEAMFNQPYKYNARMDQAWGYSPMTSSTEPYIDSITIYSMHQKSFSSYKIIRPTITSFQHGQHIQGEYVPIEHTMTLAYETVLYDGGRVSSDDVIGFGDSHYDKTASPLTSLGGGTRSFLGPGGLVESGGDILTNLQSGNFGAAALGALRTGKNLQDADLKAMATGELATLGRNILQGQNTQNTVFIPTLNSAQEGIAKAVNSVPGLIGSSARTSGVPNMNTQNTRTSSSNQGLATPGFAGGIF